MRKWILLFALLIAKPTLATTWYVGQGVGDSDSNSCASAQTDSNGSRKLTIQAGLACVGYSAGAGANHVVEVRSGTYTHSTPIGGNNDQSFPSGTSWAAPFILRCHTGETCTLKGTGSYNVYLTNSGAMYSTIGAGTSPATGGFVFDGTNLSGDQIFMGNCCQGPSAFEILGNEFINTNHENAIITDPFGTDIRIRYNYIHGGSFITAANGAGRNHAIYFTSNSSLVEYNRIDTVPGYGVHGYYATDASNNTIRYNHIKDFAQNTNGGCGILVTRTNNKVYGNIIWVVNGGAVSTQHGLCNSGPSNIFYNNTVYGMKEYGFDMTGATSAITRNNIIRNTTGNADFNSPSGTLSNNICGAAGTGCAITTDPLFVDATNGNFSLASGSSAIDAGVANITTGVTACANGSAPDIGAIETLGTPTATVNGTAAIITVPNNCTSQMLPSSSVTGWSFKKNGVADVVTANSLSGTNSYAATLTSAFVGGDTCLFTYSQTGNSTDNSNIGNLSTSNQEVLAFTDSACTNITSGTGTVGLSHWRVYTLQGATDTAWIPVSGCAADFTNCTVPPGARLWVRVKLRNNSGTNVSAFNLSHRWRYNGGSYVTLTTSYVNGIKVVGTGSQPGTVVSDSTTLTQDQLTSDETTNVACLASRSTSSIPSLTLANSNESECAQGIDISTSATPGDTYEYCPYKDDGTALTCSTPLKLTVGNYSSMR